MGTTTLVLILWGSALLAINFQRAELARRLVGPDGLPEEVPVVEWALLGPPHLRWSWIILLSHTVGVLLAPLTLVLGALLAERNQHTAAAVTYQYAVMYGYITHEEASRLWRLNFGDRGPLPPAI